MGIRKKYGVRELKAPFLKVEDCAGLYRPLVIVLTKWPEIDFNIPAPYPPFHDISTSKPKSRTKRYTGFCELCNLDYQNLQTHLSGVFHQSKAADDSLFAGIDSLIQKYKNV